MMLLDGPASFEAIATRCVQSTNAMFCVAFWGRGAAQKLGIVQRSHAGKSTEIILNLIHGGCNPVEVRVLRALENVKVLQCDNLHAKIYALDNWVLVGSSNASTNGLSYEDGEVSGWAEANIAEDSLSLVNKVASFCYALDSREIQETDLCKAEAAWRLRRQSSPVLPRHRGTLVANPGRYTLVVYGTPMSEQADELQNQLQKSDLGPHVEVFEGWDSLPKSGDLICFNAGRRKFTFDGIWNRNGIPTFKDLGTNVQPCYRTDEAPEIDEADWQDIAKWLWKHGRNGEGQFMPLDQAIAEHKAASRKGV